MKLLFLGKESTPKNSPTLYATEEDSYVIQGWVVTDQTILAQLSVADGHGIVEVPPGLLNFLSLDGLDPTIRNLVPPIVHVKDNGNYIIEGKRVTDSDTLSQMNIPDYESCVLVSKSAVSILLGG